MLIPAQTILSHAKSNHIALAALNASSVEALQAIFEAAAQAKLPVMVAASEGESKYLIPELTVKMCEELGRHYQVDYVLHLDHGKDLRYVERALEAGFNSIHVDYSEKSLEENTAKTKEARRITNAYHAQLEGEIGVIPYHYYEVTRELEFTDPIVAAKYVQETQVDSLAVSIGTEHGKQKRVKELNIPVLQELNRTLPNIPFVLHGGSYLPEAEYLKAIENGIAKININAELRMAYTETLKKNLLDKPEEYAPYRLLQGTKEAMREVAVGKMLLFARTQQEVEAHRQLAIK